MGGEKKSLYTLIFIFIIISMVIPGCLDKDGDEEEFIDERETYDPVIELSEPFGQAEDSNYMLDEDGKGHFIYRERGSNAYLYSKLDEDGNIVVDGMQIFEGNVAGLGYSRDLPMVMDSDGFLYSVIDLDDHYELGNVTITAAMRFVKISADGELVGEPKLLPRDPLNSYPSGVTHAGGRDVQMVLDSNEGLHLVWNDQGSVGPYDTDMKDIHYMKLNREGNVLIPEMKLTNDTEIRNEYPILLIDDSDDLHVIWERDSTTMDTEIHCLKLGHDGENVQIDVFPNKIGTGYLQGALLFEDEILISWREALTEIVKMTSLSLNGQEISTEDIGEREIPDILKKGVMFITAEGFSCGGENLTFKFYRYDDSGDLVIENKTVLIILRDQNLSHGPTVNSLVSYTDDIGDLHVSYYVNNGGNQFQLHYLRFNKNGDLVLPLVVVSPTS